MKVEQWSQKQIEDYRSNTNLLNYKVNELRNQAVKEFFTQINFHVSSHLKGLVYRVTHFGHGPQMR